MTTNDPQQNTPVPPQPSGPPPEASSPVGDSPDRIHHLKTWPRYFEDVRTGIKTFEIRENDRSFQRGDHLVLREWDPDVAKDRGIYAGGPGPDPYTGREIDAKVLYVTTFGQKEGYVVMGIEVILESGETPPGSSVQ